MDTQDSKCDAIMDAVHILILQERGIIKVPVSPIPPPLEVTIKSDIVFRPREEE